MEETGSPCRCGRRRTCMRRRSLLRGSSRGHVGWGGEGASGRGRAAALLGGASGVSVFAAFPEEAVPRRRSRRRRGCGAVREEPSLARPSGGGKAAAVLPHRSGITRYLLGSTGRSVVCHLGGGASGRSLQLDWAPAQLIIWPRTTPR
ncbi:hypothetical protein ACP4OV_031540 [Aristida adscensionis]